MTKRDAGDFAETAMRVHPDARDDQHGKDTGEERHDGKEYEAQDIPASPGWIGRGSGCGLGVTGSQIESRVTMATGICRAALGWTAGGGCPYVDGRGRRSLH